LSFAEDLEKDATKFIKQWLKINKKASLLVPLSQE
jgi:hypothetical protein